MIINCIQCGKEFEAKGNQKCCSNECSINRKKYTDKIKVSNKKRKCVKCGQEFIGTYNQKYCSKECKGSSIQETKIEYDNKCEVCGKTFKSKKIDSKYCSRKCKNLWIKENPRHAKKCKQCGKEFKTNYINQEFCSYECSNENRAIFPIVTCEHCGKEFRAQHSHANKFCSRICFLKHIGAKSWDYKKRINDLTHIRRAKDLNVKYEDMDVLKVFERDNWICQICGQPVDKYLPYPNPKSASLDHIIPMSKGGTHTENNVQLAHLGCNKQKSNNFIIKNNGQLSIL